MSNPASETVRFVAAAIGVQATDEEIATETIHVGSTCQALAARSQNREQLLGGSSIAAQAEVQQWLMWAGRELHPLMDDKLLKVNGWLESRTFMAGSSLTLADLVVFGMTHPATTKFPIAQYNHFCSLLRWSDLIQSLVGPQVVAACLSAGLLTVIKPLFVAPAPPPPPTPAAAAGKADANGKAGDATGPKKGDAPGKAPAAAAAAAAPAVASAAGKADKGKKPAADGTAAPAAPAAGAGAAQASDGKKEGKKDAGAKKEGGSKKEGGGKKEEAGASDEARIDMLDIRVGRIVKVAKHPNADALYVEDIDVGEEQPRQVISGLVKFVALEEMQDRRVLVVCNLKPAKMRDVMSYGMVLCASNDSHDKVEPVTPPEGAPLGERVSAQGFGNPPLEEINPKKKNLLELLFPDMKTNAEGVPCYKGAPFTTSCGVVTSNLPDAWVK